MFSDARSQQARFCRCPGKLDVSKITEYLNKGSLLSGWMGYFIDIRSKELISPNSYYTDGIWVWPAYLSYYLIKYPFFKLDEEFLDYLKKKGFEFELDENFDRNKSQYESDFSKQLRSVEK